MFLTAPIIIYVLLKNKKAGLILISLLFVIFSIVPAYVMHKYSLHYELSGIDVSDPNYDQ